MPAKRKPAASAPRAGQKQPAKRRSKLAKENDITADQEAELQEAFALFAATAGDHQGHIATADLRRCLIALNAPPANSDELNELIDIVDDEGSGWITYDSFLPVAALQLSRGRNNDDEAVNAEVEKAHRLFTQGHDRPIVLSDLKRIAKELREVVSEDVLKDMLREATGGGLGGVTQDEFERVMRRAGVFS